jgi:hypothetical protein
VNNLFSNLAVAVMTALLILSFSGFQVTGETVGPRLLGRLAASLVELDRWVPVHREDLQLLARDRSQELVLIDDLPVDVLVPSQTLLGLGEDDAALSILLRDAMGQRLYAEGRDALQGESGEANLGVTDPMRWAVSMLSSDAHGTWRLFLIGSGLVTLLFAGSFVLSHRSPLGPLAGGAGIAVVVSFLGWLIFGGTTSVFDSAVDREIVRTLRDSAWLGVRNSLAAGGIALALWYLHRALVGPRMDDNDYYWPEAEEVDEMYGPDPDPAVQP